MSGQRLNDDYRAVFGSGEGKRVLEDLMRFCGHLRTSFCGDMHKTAFFEGQRNVYLYVLGRLARGGAAEDAREAEKE